MTATACGKKGPPLAPILHIPAAITQITAARLGGDVFVTFTPPVTNVDMSIPVDLARVEVFGYTGRAMPPLDRFAEVGTLIATIPIDSAPQVGEAAPAGGAITILNTLTPDELVQGPEPIDSRRSRTPVVVPATTARGPLRRFYLAIPFSPTGRPGPPGAQADVPLAMVPDPPVSVRATYSPTSVILTWEPAGGLLGLLLDNPLPPEPAPIDETPASASAVVAAGDGAVPPGPTRYNVYRELAPDPLASPSPAGAQPGIAMPAPVNPSPLGTTTLEDDIAFGRERCYTVRAIRGDATTAAVSEPSSRVCVTPIDIFPPAAPTGLVAVPSEGGVNLIWEPNGEPDLGGYLILRREVGSATLRQLTDSPIPEARFRDSNVTAGMRYSYSVVAVDRQVPLPNASAESAPVEETAR